VTAGARTCSLCLAPRCHPTATSCGRARLLTPFLHRPPSTPASRPAAGIFSAGSACTSGWVARASARCAGRRSRLRASSACISMHNMDSTCTCTWHAHAHVYAHDAFEE
jgi:hypothetical protein